MGGSTERMEWKERQRRNVVYTGMMHEGLFSGFWWQRVVTERQIREHGAHIREANSLLRCFAFPAK